MPPVIWVGVVGLSDSGLEGAIGAAFMGDGEGRGGGDESEVGGNSEDCGCDGVEVEGAPAPEDVGKGVSLIVAGFEDKG